MAQQNRKPRIGIVAFGALLCVLTLAGVTACFGDDEGGILVRPQSPTATARPRSSPIAGSTRTPTATPAPQTTPTTQPTVTSTGTPDVVPVTPVACFVITTEEGVNIRERPTISSDPLGVLSPGEKRNVIGQASGDEAIAGQGTTWYALQNDGGFIYKPLVTTVEGESC